MKFVFVCGAGLVSGKEKQTLAVMTYLKGKGHDVFCIMASWGADVFAEMLRHENIPYRKLRIGFISKTFSFSAILMTLHQLVYVPSLWWKYRKFLASFKPEVVVHTNFHHLFLLLPVLGKSKQVFYVHDYFAPTKFIVRLFVRFRRKVDLFVGVSDFIGTSLVELGVPREKVVRVYNGIVPPGKSRERQDPNPVTIGIVGQVSPWKGHEVLIMALTGLRDLANWNLQIIGEGEESFKLTLIKLIGESGLEGRVVFRGRIAGLESIYSEIDIACVPSIAIESFGLVAVEPGFFEIPVICSKIGALGEVVVHGETGLMVEPGDTGGLTDALLSLIKNPAERARLGGNAGLFVREHFSLLKTAGEFERFCGQL